MLQNFAIIMYLQQVAKLYKFFSGMIYFVCSVKMIIYITQFYYLQLSITSLCSTIVSGLVFCFQTFHDFTLIFITTTKVKAINLIIHTEANCTLSPFIKNPKCLANVPQLWILLLNILFHANSYLPFQIPRFSLPLVYFLITTLSHQL